MDHNLTVRIKKWLDEDSHTTTGDILEGATMLLQLNRNRALFNTIVRRPERHVSKIAYELRKFLPARLEKMTMKDVEQMEEELMPELSEAIESVTPDPENPSPEELEKLPARDGKRPDHAQLPETIQAIWDENAARWKKVKSLYNTLVQLKSEQPCDRYEYLAQLKDLWYKYKADFDRYDTYELKPVEEEDPVKIAANISNFQKYISKFSDKLITLKKAVDEKGDDADHKDYNAYKKQYDALFMRIDYLMKHEVRITQETLDKLREGGLEISVADNEQSEDTDSDAAETAE